MNYSALVPFDPKSDFAPRLETEKDVVMSCVKNDTPVITQISNHRDLHECRAPNQLVLRVALQKPLKRAERLRFSAEFHGGVRNKYWGLKFHLELPRDPAQPIVVVKGCKTGHPDQESDEEFLKLMRLLGDTLAHFLSRKGPAADILPGDVCGAARAEEVSLMVLDHATDFRDVAMQQKIQKAQAEEEFIERIRALPDGTPLVIRQGLHSILTQIGIKRGNVSRKVALNCRVPSPVEIRSDAFLQAGLSRHTALVLGIAAEKALEQDPGVGSYQAVPKNARPTQNLDAGQPFHASWVDPKTRRSRRANGPRIHIQTKFPFRHFDHLIDGKLGAIRWKDIYDQNPCYGNPGDPEPQISSFRQSKPALQLGIEPFRDFDTVCNMPIVSDAVAEILAEHDIGQSLLREVLIEDEAGKAIETRHLLVLREDHPSIVTARLPALMKHWLKIYGVADEAITVNGQAAGDLDLWFDSQLPSRPMLLSGRLVRALRREKLQMPSALKLCLAI